MREKESFEIEDAGRQEEDAEKWKPLVGRLYLWRGQCRVCTARLAVRDDQEMMKRNRVQIAKQWMEWVDACNEACQCAVTNEIDRIE